MENKTDLRIWAKSIRKTLDLPEISRNITGKIRSLELYKNAGRVMIFYPLKYEINLLGLLEDEKSFYLPSVDGENLLVRPFEKDGKLIISELKIPEPLTEPVSPEILDLIIVPALVADKNNFRLGYGGGFYDRFLAKVKVPSIVPVPVQLLVDKIPVEEFDVPVFQVITG